MRLSLPRSGMTLIEVMVVVSAVGILAGVALPKAAAIQESIALESAAQQLMREMNLAQVRAIKENRTIPFAFTSATQYQIAADQPHALPSKLHFGTTPAAIQFASFGPPLTGPVTVRVESNTGKYRVVALNANGYVSLQ
jgi:prepilin-type N-terminal cleavage/methylation domain-containing protein